jgi:hypothetical protein
LFVTCGKEVVSYIESSVPDDYERIAFNVCPEMATRKVMHVVGEAELDEIWFEEIPKVRVICGLGIHKH